ncbi:TPA: hypothetical protein PEF01_002523 [Staphylococcus aureus]|nr:hypothetical protein [Staphylococcus aureus]
MELVKNKKLSLIIIVILIITIFFIFKGHTIKLNFNDKVKMDGYKFSINGDDIQVYKKRITVPMRIENLKNKENPLYPAKTFNLIVDGKKAKMKEFSNSDEYINGTSFQPKWTFALDMVYEIKGHPKSYKLQIRDRRLLKDKVYEYDLTPHIINIK